MSDAEVGGLQEIYRDLNEIERRPEGVRYTATLGDGSAVFALALAPNLTARIRHPDQFDAAFARAATIRHDGIATPLAWGRTTDGRLHYAFGRTRLMRPEPGTLSPSDVAIVGVRLCGALAAIHAAGLSHGAISTAAIVQSVDRGPQLTRFGLFAALSAGGLGVQASAMQLSDAPYVSPEVQAGKEPNPSSDIFSLGASLYDLLTGKPPYGGRTTSFVMASVLTDQKGATEKTNDAIAGPVIEALLRAIEHAPDDRWPNADAFGQALSFGATSGEMAAAPKRESWIAAIFRSWFPARRSRG